MTIRAGQRFMSSSMCILVLLLMLASGVARAQADPGLCNALKSVLAQTEGHYLQFRGSYDAVQDAYKGSLAFPPMSDCYTSAKGEWSSYKCKARFPDDEAAVRQALADTAAAVEQCLGQDVKRMSFKADARYVFFRHQIGGESIRVRYQRIVPKYTQRPAFFLFTLEVGFHEPD